MDATDKNPAVEVLEALAGLIGLVQLVLARDDLPQALREVLTTNHRFTNAVEVFEKHR